MSGTTTTSSSSPAGNNVRRRVGNIPTTAINELMQSEYTSTIVPESGSSKYHYNKKRVKGSYSNVSFSIIPIWFVALMCGLFLLIGYIQQSYYYQTKSIVNNGSINNNIIKKQSLLTPQEDIELEYDPISKLRYHVVFSTDCSLYQHWQSYLVYYSAMKIKQYGHITRIVSGCNTTEETLMNEWFSNEISYMSKRFHIVLTPSFSTIKNDITGEIIGDYKFFNKPFGLLYYMEHFHLLQFNNATETKFPKDIIKNDVIILIDPDMGFIKPITSDYTNPNNVIISDLRKDEYSKSTVLKNNHEMKLSLGQPIAQTYGFGTQWLRLNLSKITNDINTPALNVSGMDGRLYYPVGPPYIVMVDDMYQIVKYWSAFVKPTYDEYPHLLAEMFAYCIAAAHAKLPHIVLDSLMVSDIDMDHGEGWSFIDNNDIIPYNQTCSIASNIISQNNSSIISIESLPNVFHMCQRYSIGNEWFFSKRKIPSNIYDCNQPLFRMPTNDIIFNTYKYPPGGKKQDITIKERKRYTFSICFLYSLLNDAIYYHKINSCNNPNLSYTRNLVDYALGKEDFKKLFKKTVVS